MIKDYKKKKLSSKNITEPIIELEADNRNSWKIKLVLFVLFVIAFGIILARTILSINAWSEKNIIRTQSPITFNRPVWVETRQPLVVLSPIVEQAAKEEFNAGSPIEQEILRLWGEKYFLLVRSVFKCESGLKEDAVNWKSQDIGVAQINWPTWEKKVAEKFGYSLKDMFDYKKNLEVAHWISDRNNDGNVDLTPWVVYNQGKFVGCIQ